MRKLATTRKISELHPIENANMIEVAVIDGWRCVVKKGEFVVGDTVVFCEIDSLIPCDNQNFGFLDGVCKVCWIGNKKYFLIKSKKIKGVVSQGVCVKLSNFENSKELEKCDSVTEQLGIKKYIPFQSLKLKGDAVGSFPLFIKKTDQERIQNLTDYFELYKDVEFVVTEKLDGVSLTTYYRDGHFGCCSKNVELKKNDSLLYWKVVNEFNIEKIMTEEKMNDYALQWEIVGMNVRGNPYHKKCVMPYLFNIYDIGNQEHLPYEEKNHFVKSLRKKLWEEVPYLYTMKVFNECKNVNEIMELAKENSMLNKDIMREGIVCKSITPVDGKIISFKVINNEYLL